MDDALIIITKDTYLRIAIIEMMKSYWGSGKLCVIDLCSCDSLKKLKGDMDVVGVTDEHKVILLGDRNVYSRMLEPLGVLDIKSSVGVIKNYIRYSIYIPIIKLKRFIASQLQLNQLNTRQIIVCTLYSQYNFDMKMIGRVIGVAEKTAYGIAECSVKLLNLKSLSQLAFFLTNDFNYAELNNLFF